MKKAIIILTLLLGFDAAAQIRLSNFSQSFTDGTGADVRTAKEDPDGKLCAVLKLETRLSGWTFDAGLAGITDTRFEDGTIWLYIPASARFLTVSHKDYGVLREWTFPTPLEPGRTYTARLTFERPKAAPTRSSMTPPTTHVRTARVSQSAPLTSTPAAQLRPSREKTFCQHFADFYVGAACTLQGGGAFEPNDDTWFGFSYTWVGSRVGPYLSAGMDFEGGWELIGGATFRLTNPQSDILDWQLYGGVGFIDGGIGFDFGTRFAWRSSYQLSHWDFGFGCQYFQGNIMPTVSVGLYIWGIPTVICLGIVAGAL